MRRSEDPTLRQMKVPVALIIEGTEALISAVSDAALAAQVLVAECTSRDAATIAAEMRPLVIIVTEELYRADQASLDALARDVRAAIMPLPADGAVGELQKSLEAKMLEAESQRPSWPPP